ncbi:hypothetical protein GCK72_005838 [Caenorhabditis remanei]|uniref:Uncharacterized protein n=1 Tax=Caenorhabditis remanei TaxID=31234 RepID=A0A6A5HET1_CAERE|nr:hypothetical protein GCK72_005838 [Caenorhabditis remanei]KAF1765885.1 hypothetical protein GCK72_005838 [Caenorhabditis remanei]
MSVNKSPILIVDAHSNPSEKKNTLSNHRRNLIWITYEDKHDNESQQLLFQMHDLLQHYSNICLEEQGIHVSATRADVHPYQQSNIPVPFQTMDEFHGLHALFQHMFGDD